MTGILSEKYDLPIIRTVQPPDDFDGEAYLGDGPAINSDLLDGLYVEEAKTKIIGWLEENGKGRATIQYKLRDWLFSRQRYWGEPFPVIHVDGDPVPLSEDDLPLELPEVEDYQPAETGDPPLSNSHRLGQCDLRGKGGKERD